MKDGNCPYLRTTLLYIFAGLRAFLVTLAVVDDIGATIVISLVYHEGFALFLTLLGLCVIVLLLTINKAGVQSLLPYLILGLFLWAAFIESGNHTSGAGVILALTIPVRSHQKGQEAPLARLEHVLSPWVNYLILPVFALSNAGIIFQGTLFSTIFLANLAFPGEVLFDHSKLGILPASVVAAFSVWLILAMISRTETGNQSI